MSDPTDVFGQSDIVPPERRRCDRVAAGTRPNGPLRSMTDKPGLSFATNIMQGDAPNVAYAMVYSLTTLLRILSAQVLAILLLR